MVGMREPQTYLDRAIADGQAELTGEGRGERIRYIAANRSERYADPEEKVRAELWAELIFKYGYSPKRIGFEVTVPRRTPADRADLVIYRDKDMKAPYFVIECKREDISDAAFTQSIEQACGNRANLGAQYCGSVAGLTRRFLNFEEFPPGERERNHMTDIPVSYGNPQEWRFYKNELGKDLAAVPREQLRAAIRKCHQTLWEGGLRNTATAFGEFSKIVFIKHRDENNLDRRDGSPYDFQRRSRETPPELAARIKRLYDKEQRLEPEVFRDSIRVDPPILAQCVEHLEGISLQRTELDTKGVAFEEFMGSHFKGDFGQYFTPRELIAFCVAMLDPQRNDLVLDPACGSGGFLLYALDHVRRKATELYPDTQSTPHYRYWHDFAQNNLFGIEISEEIARVAKMNMIIHDDGHTNIVRHDGLDFHKNIRDKNLGLAAGRFDIVLSNPPFGAVVRRSEKGDDYLEQFDLMRYLGKNFPPRTDMTGRGDETERGFRGSPPKSVRQRASIKTEIAFIERIHSFLKPGEGRAAVVLPDGVLTNSSLMGVRQWILERFQLLAVVSLPQFAFSHYDAGVKASIVFLRRLADGETVSDDEPVFMAIADNIGYDATGRKTFVVELESETPRREKVENHKCDLFDYRVFYDWIGGVDEWSESRREVIPGTGIVEQWQAFLKDPTSFLAMRPDEAADAKAFALQKGNIAPRMDPHFNHPRYTALNKRLNAAPVLTPVLGELLKSISSGATPNRSDTSLYADSGVKLLRILNVDDGEIVDNDMKYITDEVHNNDLNRSQLAANDVLMTITGRVGSAAVVREEHLPANINQHIVRMRVDEARCRPQFLAEWLNCPAGVELSNRPVSGGTRPALDYGAIRNIRIPLPDTLQAQDRLISAIDAARQQRIAMLADADALLSGIGDFLFDALGITPLTEGNRQAFTVTRRNMMDLSFGPSRYAPELQALTNKLRKHPATAKPLSAYANINPQMDVSKLVPDLPVGFIPMKAVSDGATGEYSVETKPLGDVVKGYTRFSDGDILWAKIDHCMQNGNICIADNLPNGLGFGSTEFHVLRVQTNDVMVEFVKEFVSQATLRRLAVNTLTGSVQKRVPASFLAMLPFPELPVSQQREIVASIKSVRQEARRLRVEADAVLQDAKRQFERALLGSDS